MFFLRVLDFCPSKRFRLQNVIKSPQPGKQTLLLRDWCVSSKWGIIGKYSSRTKCFDIQNSRNTSRNYYFYRNTYFFCLWLYHFIQNPNRRFGETVITFFFLKDLSQNLCFFASTFNYPAGVVTASLTSHHRVWYKSAKLGYFFYLFLKKYFAF